jgi:predicted CxxxxCH...CXXCH cytochrome family protein
VTNAAPTRRRTQALAILLALAASAFACARLASRAAPAEPGPQRHTRRTRRRAPSNAQAQSLAQSRADYTKFSHATAQHRKACDSCHESPTANWAEARPAGAAFPDITDYPAHASCLGCHRRQFFSGARPAICTVCHTQVSPRSGARFPFENPSEAFSKSAKAKTRRAEFAIYFPHDRHQDLMARALPTRAAPAEASRAFGFVRATFAPRAADERPVDSCTICHQTYQPAGDPPEEYVTKPPAELPSNALGLEAFWLKRGMFKTTPRGHESCFRCHWQDGGESPRSNDCAGCHRLLSTNYEVKLTGASAKVDADASNPSVKGIADADVLARWFERRVATFRHEKADHVKVGCTACHVSITSADRLTAETDFVPIKTCASSSCHGSTNKAAGAKRIIFDEVEQKKRDASYACAKCHINLGREPTPKSHTDLFAK